jgi:hypothetical protein
MGKPALRGGGARSAVAIGTSVGPLAQGGLDEALRFAVGAWCVGASAAVPEVQGSAGAGK